MESKIPFRLLRHFFAAYPRHTLLIVFYLVVAGLAEGVSLITLLPLLDLALGSGAASNSTVSRLVSDVMALAGLSPTLGTLLLLIVGGILAKALFSLWAMREVGYTVAHVMTDLRLKLIQNLFAVRWAFLVSRPIGQFSNAISSEAVRAAAVYHATAHFLALAVQALIHLAAIILVSWQVALLGMAVAALTAVGFNGLVQATRRAGARQTELMQSMTRRLTDALQGIKPIKAMALDRVLLPFLESEAKGLEETQKRTVLTMETLRLLQEPVLVAVIGLGLYLLVSSGAAPFPALLVLVFLFYRLLNRFNALQQTHQAVAVGESAFWSLHGAIEEARSAGEVETGGRRQLTFNEEIRFSEVSFSYPGGTVLDRADLSIRFGEFVAMVGPSGVGKTTVVDLIAGLMAPASGRILVDGVPLPELNLRSWRHLIGYVPQEMFLFHDSVAKNVSLSDPGVSRGDVESALQAAKAWEFVSSLPEGMDTVIGERGAKLSGGQRQRIAIARALVRRPRLLILDEVTASLDPESESEICDMLRALRGTVTIIAISHQSGIIAVADRLLELADGTVQELARAADQSGFGRDAAKVSGLRSIS